MKVKLNMAAIGAAPEVVLEVVGDHALMDAQAVAQAHVQVDVKVHVCNHVAALALADAEAIVIN